MLNIVVPLAGRGSRFQIAGYDRPKPLILIHGKPMITVVIHNLRPRRAHRWIFLCLSEHLDRYPLAELLHQSAPGCEIVRVQGVTEGAACTVLLARSFIENDDALMIANSDQWVDFDVNRYLNAMDEPAMNGLILTMKADDPKWSFVRLDDRRRPLEVVEKQVVSDEATVGIYNFQHGRDFVEAADQMISRNIRVNNEFYVAPCYNPLLKSGMTVGLYNVGDEKSAMHGLGTPDDLEHFLRQPVSRRAVDF